MSDMAISENGRVFISLTILNKKPWFPHILAFRADRLEIPDRATGYGYEEIFERCFQPAFMEVIIEDPWFIRPNQVIFYQKLSFYIDRKFVGVLCRMFSQISSIKKNHYKNC